MKRSQGPRCMTGVSHSQKAGQRLKTCEDCTFCMESDDQRYLGPSRYFSHRFSDRTTNHNSLHYSKLPQDTVKPTFRSKRRGYSVTRVCLLYDNACPHTATVTRGYWRKYIGRYCHSPHVVLTWHQAICTCSVHSKGPR
jgi:hypothetical protein